ncbi:MULTISPECIES: helix-turn-helix transcriptional regulator [Sinorhizobium]|uniref:AraC family transcriptional regulator protein n=1 Tax=Rhizobium fredii TaxID=380 RepID=A0A2L0HHN8_RHIFR|nr:MULTISPECIES: AraC family transcriptional regulator [Sinorhizobium]AUX80589.1 AraC family transcriptional regulator protein [Sinorhizobium fredii]
MQQSETIVHASGDSEILNVIPASAGPRLATARGGAIHAIRPPGSQTLVAENHFAAVMLAPAQRIRAALGSDRMQEYDAPVGAIVIQPPHVEVRAEWTSTREELIVAFRSESLLDLAMRELELGEVALQPPAFGTVDLKALRFAELLKMELIQQEPPSEIYVDSLVTLFGIHLLRGYSAARKQPADVKGGLSAAGARRIREFLHENFTRKMTVAELAAIAGLSPYYFIRAFTKTFGQPPHQYVLALRLSFAEKLLGDNNLTIAEVAYLSGFSSQSHLTAVMRKHRDITPTEIRMRL